MRTDITYVSNSGERITFGGSSEELHYFANDLRKFEWTHNFGVAKNRVMSFTREPKTLSFKVGIAAESESAGIAWRNKIATLGEYDIAHMMPGKLYVGDWYISCWIVSASFDNYWMSDRFAEIELGILAERVEWTHDLFYQFVPTQTVSQGVHGANFPYNFEHDFMASFPAREIENSATFAADFIWRAYGPVTNPYIRIDTNLYQVNISIPDKARLEVDSRRKTCILIGADGTQTNVFNDRTRGAHGSGSYIFERIEPGINKVSWANTYIFDLILMESCSIAPFEEG